jgi:DNA polymerase I-like protein with 3'-5' exonuclease and polymerase domains
MSCLMISSEQIPEDELKRVALAVSVLDSNIAEPTIDDIYRAGRARVFEEAKKNILDEIKEKELEFIYDKVEIPLMPILRQMERRAYVLIKSFWLNFRSEYHEELKKIEKRIYKEAGVEFNINSPKQLGEMLYDKLALKPERQKKTATGARTTRESELEKMRGMHPIIVDIPKPPRALKTSRHLHRQHPDDARRSEPRAHDLYPDRRRDGPHRNQKSRAPKYPDQN